MQCVRVPQHCHKAPTARPSSSQVFVCRSGSAADTQNISAYVAHYLRQHEMDVGEPDVATAANIAMQIVYGNKASREQRQQMSVSTVQQHFEIPATFALVVRDGRMRSVFAFHLVSSECVISHRNTGT